MSCIPLLLKEMVVIIELSNSIIRKLCFSHNFWLNFAAAVHDNKHSLQRINTEYSFSHASV